MSDDRYEHRRILAYRGVSMNPDQHELFAGSFVLWDAWGSRGRVALVPRQTPYSQDRPSLAAGPAAVAGAA